MENKHEAKTWVSAKSTLFQSEREKSNRESPAIRGISSLVPLLVPANSCIKTCVFLIPAVFCLLSSLCRSMKSRTKSNLKLKMSKVSLKYLRRQLDVVKSRDHVSVSPLHPSLHA